MQLDLFNESPYPPPRPGSSAQEGAHGSRVLYRVLKENKKVLHEERGDGLFLVNATDGFPQ